MRDVIDTPPLRRRRTGERCARLGGRSERVVRDVLRAAAAELARSGYAALRVEDVAARAGVNKTTVYRRWPTKADLIAATLRSLGTVERPPPDTGSLRSDLLHLLRGFVAGVSTPEGQGISRMIMTEMDQPDVAAIVTALRRDRHAAWFAALRRAAVRGEIPPGTDAQLIIDMGLGTVSHKLFRGQDPVDDAFLVAVVDLLLVGARGGGAIRRP